MKKEFETPLIEIVYFDIDINLLDVSSGSGSDEFYDENVDDNGWI